MESRSILSWMLRYLQNDFPEFRLALEGRTPRLGTVSMTISDRAKERVGQVLTSGGRAVDATLGNGWDIAFLADLVGEEGRVWGFDVQAAALTATRKRLAKANLLDRCVLLHCGHERLGEFVTEPVTAVMFNLGYLPYADKEIVTRGETTVRALQAACALLRPGGVLTIACYIGHPGGAEEAAEVLAFVGQLEPVFQIEAPAEVPKDGVAFLIVVSRSTDS